MPLLCLAGTINPLHQPVKAIFLWRVKGKQTAKKQNKKRSAGS
jgi:hypothetical protein